LAPNKVGNLAPIDFEKENRLAKIISLFSKGLTQSEIAQEIGVDPSTISRDLHFIKQEEKKKIEKYPNEDILFEYLRYVAGSHLKAKKSLSEIKTRENEDRCLLLKRLSDENRSNFDSTFGKNKHFKI
jgi:hypothetical protein